MSGAEDIRIQFVAVAIESDASNGANVTTSTRRLFSRRINLVRRKGPDVTKDPSNFRRIKTILPPIIADSRTSVVSNNHHRHDLPLLLFIRRIITPRAEEVINQFDSD